MQFFYYAVIKYRAVSAYQSLTKDLQSCKKANHIV